MARRGAIGEGLGRVGAVDAPGDRVLVHRRGVGGRVGRVAGHVGDRRRPTRELVGILGGGRLRRIRGLHDVRRRRAVVVVGRGNFRVVVVLERDRVLVHRRAELRRVGRRTRHRGGRRVPPRERVGILRIGGLRAVGVRRNRSVGDIRRFVDIAVAVGVPRNLVLVHRRAELRRVGRRSRHRDGRRVPPRERVGILRIGGLGTVRVRRDRAVGDRRRVVDRAVAVRVPRDRVFVHRRAELRRVGRRSRHRDGRRVPPRERVGILRIGGLGTVRVRRDRAVGDRRRVVGVAVAVRVPRDRVLVHRVGEDGVVVHGAGDGVEDVGGNGADRVGPAGEVVGVLAGRLLGRRGAEIDGRGAGGNVGRPEEGGCRVFAEELDGVFGGRGLFLGAAHFGKGPFAGEENGADLGLGAVVERNGRGARTVQRLSAGLERDGRSDGRVVERHRDRDGRALRGRRRAGELEPRQVRGRAFDRVGADPAVVGRRRLGIDLRDADRGLRVDPADGLHAGILVGGREDRVRDHDVRRAARRRRIRRRIRQRLRVVEREREIRRDVAGVSRHDDDVEVRSLRGPSGRIARHGAGQEVRRGRGGRSDAESRCERGEEHVAECSHGWRGGCVFG